MDRHTASTHGFRRHYVDDDALVTLCGRPVTATHKNVPGQKPVADCYSCLIAAGERRRGSVR